MNRDLAATPDEIGELRRLCAKYALEDREILDRHTDKELSESIYNGAGPDSWIPIARTCLTELMSLFEPEVLIHDTQFHESDGTQEGFDRTARIWKENCRKIFDAEYPLCTWKMILSSYRKTRTGWWGIMRAANLAISGNAAYRAYREAFEARKERERETIGI